MRSTVVLALTFSRAVLSSSGGRGAVPAALSAWKDSTSLESQQLSQGEEQLKCGHLTALAPGPSAGEQRSMSSSSGLMLLPKTQ